MLEGPKLKIERAKRHFVELENVLQAFLNGKNYELARDIDPDTGDHVFSGQLHKPIPADASIIAGDVIHNLRSALDQMVSALAKANSGSVGKRNAFPVGDTAKKFEKRVPTLLENVSAKTERFIRRLKPYEGGNRSIWVLHELNILDKHNALITVTARPAQIKINFGMPGFRLRGADGQLAPFMWGFGIPNDAKIVELGQDKREIYRLSAAAASFTYEAEIPHGITFGDITDHEPLIVTLENLIKLVERIIDIAERKLV